jgi:hypothetical protein
MTVFVIGMGAHGLGVDGLLDIGRNVLLSKAQYFFFGAGAVVAVFRVRYADMDEEARNQDRFETMQESMESLWEDRPE